jgi:hypothetical protein
VRASTLTTAHLYESLVAGAIIFFVPFVWWLCSRVEKHLFLNRISLGFIGTQVTLGFFVVIEKLLKINTYGVIHRLYLVSIAVWLSVVLFSALLIKLQNNTT